MSIEAVLRQVAGRVEDHTRARADRLGEITAEKHRTAPRGGTNRNRYGQARSAPGEAPATEEGTLLSLLQVPPKRVGDAHYRVMANNAALEDGAKKDGRIILPRPLGRLSLEQLKEEVR